MSLLSVVVVAVWSSVLSGVALAGTGGAAATTTPPPASTAALEVTAVPLVAEGREDGDLVAAADGTGPATLFFSPSTPQQQSAVHEIRVRNTGEVTLFDLAVSDDRIGPIVPAGSIAELGPGEELVVRAVLAVTFQEVATGLAGLFTTTTTAVATTGDGDEVTASAGTRIELVAVFGTPGLAVALEVVLDEGDVVGGDTPEVRWTAAQRDAGEARLVRYRVSVTNTGTVGLSDVALMADGSGPPLLSATDGVQLAPGEVLVHEFDRELRATELAADAAPGAAVDTALTVIATAVDTTQDVTATARDTLVVRAVLLEGATAPPTPVAAAAPELPAAGLDAPVSSVLLGALAAVALGVLLLRAGPDRPRSAH